MIDNQPFGELYMKKLAEYMGEEGEYMVVVGGLTVPLHNAWADFADRLPERALPKNETSS
jgi:simple sugar transport system substrate-binding protein